MESDGGVQLGRRGVGPRVRRVHRSRNLDLLEPGPSVSLDHHEASAQQRPLEAKLGLKGLEHRGREVRPALVQEPAELNGLGAAIAPELRRGGR